MNRDLQTGHMWEAVNKHGMFCIGLALCNIFGYGPLENLLKEWYMVTQNLYAVSGGGIKNP